MDKDHMLIQVRNALIFGFFLGVMTAALAGGLVFLILGGLGRLA